MTNHYHICLSTPEGNLSRVMRHLDGLYTQRFNKTHGRDGSLFRGRYKAILIDADEYLSAVVRYILANNAGVLAQVGASKIKAGELPLNIVMPAISVQQFGGDQRKTVAMDSATEQWTETVDVAVHAKTYPSMKNILRLVQQALPLSRGTVNGFDVDSILASTTGADEYDSDTAIHSQSQKSS